MTFRALMTADSCTLAETLIHRLALVTKRMTSSRTCLAQHEMGEKGRSLSDELPTAPTLSIT
jgi:hypothetical protein